MAVAPCLALPQVDRVSYLLQEIYGIENKNNQETKVKRQWGGGLPSPSLLLGGSSPLGGEGGRAGLALSSGGGGDLGCAGPETPGGCHLECSGRAEGRLERGGLTAWLSPALRR